MRARLTFDINGKDHADLVRNSYLVLSKYLNVTSDEDVDKLLDFEIDAVKNEDTFSAKIYARLKS